MRRGPHGRRGRARRRAAAAHHGAAECAPGPRRGRQTRTDITFTDVGHTQGVRWTLLVAAVDDTYRDKDIRGREVQAGGGGPGAAAAGVKNSGTGEMVVSPALADLLKSGSGNLLRERLPYRTIGTIGEPGLVGANELSFYAGADNLAPRIDSSRVNRLGPLRGAPRRPDRLDPVLLLLIIVVFVVLLLLPVGVFIAAAVRFGGERRDRRLGRALRLVGSDSRMTRRIAAGEALSGAVLGSPSAPSSSCWPVNWRDPWRSSARACSRAI